MLTAVAQKKNYSLIGRVLSKIRPDISTEIETNFLSPSPPLSSIFTYYDQYKEIVIVMSKVDKRRVFCAAMLKVYHPYVLSTGLVFIKKGFTNNIKQCFNHSKQRAYMDIREAIIMYKAYEDFRTKVDDIVKTMTHEKENG